MPRNNLKEQELLSLSLTVSHLFFQDTVKEFTNTFYLCMSYRFLKEFVY